MAKTRPCVRARRPALLYDEEEIDATLEYWKDSGRWLYLEELSPRKGDLYFDSRRFRVVSVYAVEREDGWHGFYDVGQTPTFWAQVSKTTVDDAIHWPKRCWIASDRSHPYNRDKHRYCP